MTDTLTLPADEDGIARAAEMLLAGRLVAFPTETVYGLGGIATSGAAVAGIFAAKRRPQFNPLIAHVADVAAAERLVELTPIGEKFAQAFWPGPLTLVAPQRAGSGIADLAAAGLPTLAVRVPAAPVAQALLAQVGLPVAAPSANPSGKVSPTTAQHVLDGLGGRIAAVLDGGPCPVGLESTIVGLGRPEGPSLLRPGGLPAEEIEAVLGQQLSAAGSAITAPGQLASHYAPDATIRLNATSPEPGEVYLGFGAGPADLSLSDTGDLIEAAANLFAALRSLDAHGMPIAVAPIPQKGLGRAINDRLRRAAAPR
ncbi:MAG: L-threonylcarbamoyladenylate synthase [Pseudomonadota bacterium]